MTELRLPPPEGVEVVDVELWGVSGLSCSYLVHAQQTALIETGPATVFDTIVRELDRRKVVPDHVVLTHIHLDHAGGAGHVAAAFPNSTIWVHEVGAPHVVDPSRLLNSARRIFGEAMDTMWGAPEPVDEARLRVIEDGTVIPLGDRELHVLYTPGHARHEVTLFEPDTGAAFVGDTAGVMLADEWQKPATPPPEFDLEAALDSIERVKKLKASAICFTHYGPAAEQVLDRSAQDLRAWDEVLRPLALAGAGHDEMLDALRRLVGPTQGRDQAYRDAADQLSGLDASMQGYVRYYTKRFQS